MRNNYRTIVIACILLLLASITHSSILDFFGKTQKVTRAKIAEWGLSDKIAMWWKPLADGGVQCRLCPFECVIMEGERGICGVRAVVDDSLRALTYSRAASANMDPIEKKPLFHFTPGAKSFSIATAGCNLSCAFCQNWTLSQAKPEDIGARRMSPLEVVSICIENDATTIAYTYSEPTVFYEYMFETAKLAREHGISNLWITCGYISEEPLRELAKYLDAANVDLKSWSDDFYIEHLRATRPPVLRTLKILKETGVWVEITNLIIPGENDDPDQIRAMCRWIADSLGAETPVHFSRFHPNYKMTDRPATPTQTLQTAHRIAKEEGLKYVYLGNVRGIPEEDTYCPSCGEKVIDRFGYTIVIYNIKDGLCGFCGEPIDGVF